MVRGQYQPQVGDFVNLSFSPTSGTEQAGVRPGLILSRQEYNIATSLAFICPVTNQVKGSPFEVVIPKGALVTGVVLSNQLRAIDWVARRIEFISKAPNETVLEVLGRIEAILQITLDP